MPPRIDKVSMARAIALVVALSVIKCSAFVNVASSSASSAYPPTTSLTSLAQASNGSFESESPRTLVNRGMQAFRDGDVAGSIALFDRAEAAEPNIKPYLWQRGLSFYYNDEFQKGSEQFRYDVRVNPLDVEEIVWDIACQNRIDSKNINKLALPEGKKDRRPIMSIVYSLFRGDGATEHDLADAGHSGSKSDEFYSLFYLGLYCETKGEIDKAEKYMITATKTPYGSIAGDYMTACARIHCKLRGWA